MNNYFFNLLDNTKLSDLKFDLFWLINFQNLVFTGTTYLIAFTTIVSWLSYLRIWLLNMNVINNE